MTESQPLGQDIMAVDDGVAPGMDDVYEQVHNAIAMMTTMMAMVMMMMTIVRTTIRLNMMILNKILKQYDQERRLIEQTLAGKMDIRTYNTRMSERDLHYAEARLHNQDFAYDDGLAGAGEAGAGHTDTSEKMDDIPTPAPLPPIFLEGNDYHMRS